MTSRSQLAITALTAFMAAASLSVSARQTSTQTRDTRQPPPSVQPAIVGTGALGGSVTNDDGSRPVRNAYVVLIGTSKGVVKVTSTDGDGKFIFTALPADRYTVGVSKPPYLGTVAGARRPARTGTPISLADAQKISNVAIRMPMGAAITGVVVDEKGQPNTAVQVTLQQWRMQGGERTLVSAGTVSADDRGRYRFFGLQPGEYLVSAQRFTTPQNWRALSVEEVDAAMRGNAPPATAPIVPSTVRYAPVFYPGTPRAAEAQPVVVGIGEERPNVDIQLEVVQTAKVEGAVMTSDGQPVTTGSVALTTIGTGAFRTVNSTRILPDGRFAFANITPGTFAVTTSGLGPNAGQYGQAIVEVAGGDVFGVQLTMRPLLSFQGSLAFRGTAAAPALAGRRVPMKSLAPPSSGTTVPGVQVTTATGAFTVSSVLPGPYIIGGPLGFGPNTDTMTWALESVIVDGRDVTDLPITITVDTLPQNVAVTYTDRFQELTGRITRSTGAPVSEHTIIVFPEDKAYWISGSRRILITRPGTDGKFTLSGAGPTTLPPGKYLLAAITDIDKDEQFDPAFLAALVPAAVPITLQPGDKKVQDLIIR
jgi:uncharacterized protein (DUF2141 family)